MVAKIAVHGSVVVLEEVQLEETREHLEKHVRIVPKAPARRGRRRPGRPEDVNHRRIDLEEGPNPASVVGREGLEDSLLLIDLQELDVVAIGAHNIAEELPRRGANDDDIDADVKARHSRRNPKENNSKRQGTRARQRKKMPADGGKESLHIEKRVC